MALALALWLGACGVLKRSEPERKKAPEAATSEETTAPAGPVASVQINYAHAGDYLDSLSVIKYIGARQLAAETKGGGNSHSSLIRFEGGTPVWEIRADKGISGELFTLLPGAAGAKKFAVAAVKYGELPPGFVQVSPDLGSPEPLQPGDYYVFAVRRGSGSSSYQAIRVASDGTIEGYDAEPRAGTSFELCCNLTQDFTSSGDSSNSPSTDSGP